MSDDVRWAPIPGYEGLYEVSTSGSVRSLPRPATRGGILKVCTRRGYLSVVLHRDNKPWKMTIHRLMAMAFIPNPEGLPVVRHLNDCKTDNRLENLAWGTASDNQRDSVRNKSHWETRKKECPVCETPYDKVYNGRRHCSECNRRRSRERRARIKCGTS